MNHFMFLIPPYTDKQQSALTADLQSAKIKQHINKALSAHSPVL